MWSSAQTRQGAPAVIRTMHACAQVARGETRPAAQIQLQSRGLYMISCSHRYNPVESNVSRIAFDTCTVPYTETRVLSYMPDTVYQLYWILTDSDRSNGIVIYLYLYTYRVRGA